MRQRGSDVRTECLAGLTSFMSMCYLVVVVPSMLAQAGMPPAAAASAVIIVTAISTLLMGLVAGFPVGVAPGLGISAYFAFYVCGPAGYTWQEGLGAVFISGVVFLLLTVSHVRQMIIDAVPPDLKRAIVVGIGAFIAFIGLKNCGIIASSPSTFVTLGDLGRPEALLGAAGFFITGALMARGVRGAMIAGIFSVCALGMLLGVSPAPRLGLDDFVPALPTGVFMQLDIAGALGHGLFSIVFTLTMVDMFDNMGVLIGLSHKAGLMDGQGRIPGLGRALLADSLATMSSAVIGSTTATSYLESATGIAEGGRTALTAFVLAGLFLLCLFLAPLVACVPAYATAPVLVLVGCLMMQDVGQINFSDFTVAMPAFLTIVSMPMTFNIATGFGFGFICFVIVKLLTGRFGEVSPVMCAIATAFAVSFAMRGQ